MSKSAFAENLTNFPNEFEQSSNKLNWYFDLDLNNSISGQWFEAPKDGDAGFDLRSSLDLAIEPSTTILVPTGVFLAIPRNYVGLVKDRSSMASRSVVTSGGVIDSGYRGEIKIILSNRTCEIFNVRKGDKVSQIIIVPVLVQGQMVSSTKELGSSERGVNGFGSSGIR